MLHCARGNKNHYHLTLDEAYQCWGTTVLYVSDAPLPGGTSLPAAPKRDHWKRPDAPWRAKPVKDSQLDEVKRRGGSVTKAKTMNRGECSDYIDGLISGLIPPEPDEEPTKPVSAPPALTPPVVTPPAAPKQEWAGKDTTKVLTPLLKLVPEGYYASQLDDDSELHFLRVSRPESGQYKDCIKIQKMYGTAPGMSDYRLENVFILWPSGKVSVYKASLEDPINLLIADYKAAGRLFAKKKKRCLRCNASLTDSVSLKYGLGPECITTQYGQRIVAEIDDAEALRLAS